MCCARPTARTTWRCAPWPNVSWARRPGQCCVRAAGHTRGTRRHHRGAALRGDGVAARSAQRSVADERRPIDARAAGRDADWRRRPPSPATSPPTAPTRCATWTASASRRRGSARPLTRSAAPSSRTPRAPGCRPSIRSRTSTSPRRLDRDPAGAAILRSVRAGPGAFDLYVAWAEPSGSDRPGPVRVISRRLELPAATTDFQLSDIVLADAVRRLEDGYPGGQQNAHPYAIGALEATPARDDAFRVDERLSVVFQVINPRRARDRQARRRGRLPRGPAGRRARGGGRQPAAAALYRRDAAGRTSTSPRAIRSSPPSRRRSAGSCAAAIA